MIGRMVRFGLPCSEWKTVGSPMSILGIGLDVSCRAGMAQSTGTSFMASDAIS